MCFLFFPPVSRVVSAGPGEGRQGKRKGRYWNAYRPSRFRETAGILGRRPSGIAEANALEDSGG